MSVKQQRAVLREALALGKKLAVVPVIPMALRAIQERKGWVIIHPDGRVETDYFHATSWWSKISNRNVTRRTWMKHYRPNCKMVRATLTWKNSHQ